jgi:NAD(P)-dependent dehydrogenase (short-subunit alcohol dehydrogenase family)
MGERRIAVVTGGNRGLGKEVCRQLAQRGFHVVLCSRARDKGESAAAELRQGGASIEAWTLDVARQESVEEFGRSVRERLGRVDVLVNCAGVGGGGHERSILDVAEGEILETLQTNFFGALRLCRALVPLMKERGHGRVVNVSSGMGQLSDMGAGSPPYRLSKTALNVLTRVLARELEGTDVLVNSVCPGWVRTDMGGARAPLSVEEGARGIVWAATLERGGPSGGFFRHGKPIPW